MSAPASAAWCSCGSPASETPRHYGPVCAQWPVCGWPIFTAHTTTPTT